MEMAARNPMMEKHHNARRIGTVSGRRFCPRMMLATIPTKSVTKDKASFTFHEDHDYQTKMTHPAQCQDWCSRRPGCLAWQYERSNKANSGTPHHINDGADCWNTGTCATGDGCQYCGTAACCPKSSFWRRFDPKNFEKAWQCAGFDGANGREEGDGHHCVIQSDLCLGFENIIQGVGTTLDAKTDFSDKLSGDESHVVCRTASPVGMDRFAFMAGTNHEGGEQWLIPKCEENGGVYRKEKMKIPEDPQGSLSYYGFCAMKIHGDDSWRSSPGTALRVGTTRSSPQQERSGR